MFVDRDANKSINGIFACQQYKGQEELADDSPEIAAFLAPKPPTVITNAQLKRQLEADGTLAAAREAIKQADGLAEELWYGAGVFLRDDPLLLQLAGAIGYDTDEKLDAFFASASKQQ